MTKYQPIIGLEVHVELATNSKMFCGCPAEHFGVEPNTHTCPVCLALPGALPVPNKKAIEWTILLGLALECKINENSKFDRKNYFYPDLSKGYQISQYDEPLCENGKLKVKDQDSKEKVIRIRRVHLEEDTGKLQHAEVGKEQVSLVDFNRSGVPLVEIVTEPDFKTIDEVDQYLKKLQKIIRYLGISGADMEKGSMRLEPSISIQVGDSTELPPYRVELKNINSFRFARRGLEYEIDRQTKLLEAGETPVQQTRGWSESKNATVPQREKEEANDYRYFPEPDIPPLHFAKKEIDEIKKQIPELPDEKSARFQKLYGLSEYSSEILSEDNMTAEYFETAVKLSPENSKDIANWIINKKIIINDTVPADLISHLHKSKQSRKIDEGELDKIIDQILSENAGSVTAYKSGKKQVIGFLISLIKKKIDCDPKIIMQTLTKKLEY